MAFLDHEPLTGGQSRPQAPQNSESEAGCK